MSKLPVRHHRVVLLRFVRAHCWSPRCYFLYYLMLTELCDCAAFRITEKKRETLMSSAKWARGYRQADGAAIGSVRIHTHTHAKLYEGDKQDTHTCSCLVCRQCQCFSMSLGQAGCIYYALSEIVLIYHRKNSPVSGNTEWHPVRPDECDLHTQVEQITKKTEEPWLFHQEAAL